MIHHVVPSILLLLIFVTPASAVDTDALQRKQQAQEKARVLARDLVSGILDIQVRQLRENGLTDLPIYDEIQNMQVNIDALVDHQMVEVVQLLALAQEGTRDERLAHFNLARDKIRKLVVQLMAERQKLLRRMQVARLAAQVRQLIALQDRTLAATQQLPSQSLAGRDQAALDAIQDQRDVQSMFLVLVETLADVSLWSGQVGAGASDGLRILKAAQVGLEVDLAGEHLEGGATADASKSQKAVIKGLQALLEKIEQTRGLISGDREVALKMVGDIIKNQEQLRDEVQKTDQPKPEETEQLVTEQAEIHKSIGKLAEMLEHSPAAEPLLEQAKASAYEAAAQLFEENKTAAVAEQGRVIGSLAEIEEHLKHEISSQRDDKSAEELAEELQRLTQLKNDLEAIAEQQSDVVAKAADQPAEARDAEQQVAEALGKAQERSEANDQDLPGVIESRVADAREAVETAIEQLADRSDAAEAARQETAANAQEAIDRALAETKAQLADTGRRQLAVELGELARAAEALERAAVSEREIAAAADQAAQSGGLAEEQADAFAEEQDEVAAVAEKVAAGVQSAAPEAAEQLKQAAKPLAKVADEIKAAQENPDQASTDNAKKIAQSTAEASQALKQAAATLRDKVQQSARELVALADDQLEDVARVQSPVAQAMAEMPRSARDAQQQIQQAMNKVRKAQSEQQRASGREQAARAAEFAQQVTEAAGLQTDANRAAADVASGRANTPLDAAAMQQEAAERAADMADLAAELAEGAVAESLQQAARAASEAARETLGGDPNRAAAARQAATQALAAAQEQATEFAAQADSAPPGLPNVAAQARVGQLAAEAEQMADAAVPAAASSLADAQTQSQRAQDAITADQTLDTADAQQAAGESLSQAAGRLQNAADQLARQQAEQVARQGERAGELADAASVVSPDAAAALRAVERTAQDATASQPQSAEMPTSEPFAAGESVERSLERAAASLAARQQEIQHDRDIAEAIADVVEQQQAAREEIDQQSEALAEMGPLGQGDNSAPRPEQVAAARALQQATQQFAQAQRATGQGAAEISQQEQVANVPLREGLQAASQLAMGLPPDPVEAFSSEATPPVGDLAEATGDTPPTGEAAPASATPAAQSPAGQPAQPAPSSDLGTGLVPRSPEVTAQQIAGSQAMQQAEQTLAMAPPAASSPTDSQSSTSATGQEPSAESGQSEMPGTPASSAALATQADAANTQSETSWSPSSEPNSQTDNRTSDGNSDADVKLRMFRDEPWFAKLPPSLRSAIEARARRRAPRGYEERLRRYFESVD